MNPESRPRRANDEWLSDLGAPGPRQEAALADLRALLARGLRLGLIRPTEVAEPEWGGWVDDFAQEALLKVLEHLHTFRGESQFTTWAHKIAVRVALTELRRRRWKDASLDAMVERGETGDDTQAWAATGAGSGPEAKAEQADLVERLGRMMMEELTDRQRRAMVAVNVRGVPMGEVARRMGMERNALYKLLHDARLRLKRRLARDGLTPEDLLSAFSGE